MTKRLVICCDGTWNTPDETDQGAPVSTNVTKLALAIAGHDSAGIEQQMFYSKGVGTGRFDHWITPSVSSNEAMTTVAAGNSSATMICTLMTVASAWRKRR